MKPPASVATRSILTILLTKMPGVTTLSGSSAPSSTTSCTVATVHEVVELGALDPESVVTPGIFVSKIVRIDRVATEAGGFKKAA